MKWSFEVRIHTVSQPGTHTHPHALTLFFHFLVYLFVKREFNWLCRIERQGFVFNVQFHRCTIEWSLFSIKDAKTIRLTLTDVFLEKKFLRRNQNPPFLTVTELHQGIKRKSLSDVLTYWICIGDLNSKCYFLPSFYLSVSDVALLLFNIRKLQLCSYTKGLHCY